MKHLSLPIMLTGLLGMPCLSPPAGATDWTRCGGPIGGLGYDVRMRPGNQDTMLVTDSFAGAFKSVDGGQHWYPVNTGIQATGGLSGDAIKVFCLTIDPNDPDIVWCGLQDYLGIYKSTDGGETWIEKVNGIDLGPEGISFRGISVDPYNSDIVYAAGEVSSSVWNGELIHGREFDKTKGIIYKTVDGGETWSQAWFGDNLARYIWIDPRDTDVLYASTGIFDREAADCDTASNFPGGVGVLKSMNGGLTWERKNNGLTDLYVGTLFMHPLDPDILLAGTSIGPWPDTSGVFLTTNGADSWTRVLPFGVQSVEFALSGPDTAYAGNGSAVFRSINGGLTWVERTDSTGIWGPPGIEAGFPIDFQVDPDDANRIFTNNYGGGNFLSTDGGRTWSVASQGYTGAHVRDIAVAPDDPARVYAAARTGIFRSLNRGGSWEGRNYHPAQENEWNVVTVNPHDPLHVLGSGNKTLNMFYSHDGADTWTAVGDPLPDHIHWRCITFAPADTNLVYAGTGATLTISQFESSVPARGIYKSTNGGAVWGPANDSLSQLANVADLAVVDSVVVYAATTNQGMLKTMDGGATWFAVNENLPGVPAVLSVAVDPADSSHVLAGLEAAGLHESFDGGLNWDPVPAGLPVESDVSSIIFSPVDPGVVYMGDRRSGVYRSQDGGATWLPMNYGLRTRAVNALALSADGQTLYAGTEGEGVYRLEGAPTVAVGPAPVSDPPLLMQSYPNPGGRSVTMEFTLRTPGFTSLTVFDVSGRPVRTILSERRREGPHQVVWDGRDEHGRSMPSGVYFYRLRSGAVNETRRLILTR